MSGKMRICCRNLGFRFKLLSYNILSQTLLHEHRGLYQKCNPRDLEWPNRGYRVLSQLLLDRADIICLQEVECEHLKSIFKPRLEKVGYDCLYKQKTGQKVDGCAIFYKRRLFHLHTYKGIEFNRQDIDKLLNKDNVGIIAVFEPKSACTKSRLVVANTHLIFNPRRNDIKMAQLRLFLNELDQLSFKSYDAVTDKRRHHPTILCGDFNSKPRSIVCKFITQNTQPHSPPSYSFNLSTPSDYSMQQIASSRAQENLQIDDKIDTNSQSDSSELNFVQPFVFRSAYPSQTRDGQKLASSLSHCVVDYIYYTPKLRLESYKKLPTVDQFRKCGPIPNYEHPSDHLFLEAKFRLL